MASYAVRIDDVVMASIIRGAIARRRVEGRGFEERRVARRTAKKVKSRGNVRGGVRGKVMARSIAARRTARKG